MSASVLVVHQSLTSADQFAAVIKSVGLDVTVAGSPEAAWQSIHISRPDLILLDGNLSLKDSTLCKKLRLCCPEKRLPIILLIPHDPEDISHYLCGSDADDYICQPYSIKEFEARLMLRLSAAKKSAPRPLPNIDFSFLSDISSLAIEELSCTEILQRVVKAVSEVISVKRCSVAMLRDDDELAYVMASSDDPGVNGLLIELDKYPEIQATIETCRPLLIDDVVKHPLMEKARQHLTEYNFNSILVLPMVNRGKPVGVLMLRASRSLVGFTEQEVAFCQLVANVAASALRLSEIASLEQRVRQRGQALGSTGPAEADPGQSLSLLGMAAHDLRVLVSVIDGYCVLLGETVDEAIDSEQGEIINGLMAGNRRLVDMANDLLDFSQLNSGGFELTFLETDLCQVLDSVCSELSPLLLRRNISLQTEFLDAKVPVMCDEKGIRRVFYNIVNNALKFTPEGGSIRLELSAVNGEARVSVEDSGSGIEPGQIATLFDDYTTGSAFDPRSGSGLGLSICKKIIEAHHGRIWAESCLGQGSRFIFCLPR